MKRHVKAFTALLLTFAIALTFTCFPAATIQAVKFGDTSKVPNAYWDIKDAYDAAKSSNNVAGIKANAEKLINFWLNKRTVEQCVKEWSASPENYGYEINDLWSLGSKLAEMYESEKDYTNAAKFYNTALAVIDLYIKVVIPATNGSAANMEFAKLEITNKLAAWNVTPYLYVEIDAKDGVGDTSYTGAKHEPKTGIYYGEPIEKNAVESFSKKPSGTLIYVLYETDDLTEMVKSDLYRNEAMHGVKTSDYSVIEVAWNFKNEGDTLKSVPGDSAKVTKAAEYLNSLGVPILLRVGGEMNVWAKKADPQEFKAAFRFIADIMHKSAPNVAVLWSVNHVSAAGLDYEMYYPGEQYVDWVGISLYVRKYFQGDPNTSNSDAAIWGTGSYVRPIKEVETLVNLYGSKHPIIISEGGVTLHNSKNNENMTDWALPRMRQLYSYIPMLFPQVKGIFWFNTHITDTYRYDFSDSPQAKELYGQLTSSGYFLGRGQTSPSVTYKKLGDATVSASSVKLLTYAPYFTMDDIVVEYFLDGKKVGQSADIPYRLTKDFSGETDGAHKMEVRILSGGSVLTKLDCNIAKSGSKVTVYTGSAPAPTPTPTPTPAPTPITVNPSQQTMIIDGKKIEIDAYLINNQNYVKLRDFAYSIMNSTKGFFVDPVSDPAAGVINVYMTKGGKYVPNGSEMQKGDGKPKLMTPSNNMVFFIDGNKVDIKAYMTGGNNYLRIRDLLEYFNICADYKDGVVTLDTTRPFSESTI